MPLDIGVGILLSVGAAEYFQVPLTPWLVCFGILVSLLPDIDIVTTLWGKWQHRTITHYPLLYVPVVLVAWFVIPPAYAAVLTLALIAHFIHDTIGIGWGVAWLWPFSRRKILFFPEAARRPQMGWCSTWLPEEEEQFKQRVEGEAPASEMNWVREFYLRPSLIAYIEYGTLLIALVTLTAYQLLH